MAVAAVCRCVDGQCEESHERFPCIPAALSADSGDPPGHEFSKRVFGVAFDTCFTREEDAAGDENRGPRLDESELIVGPPHKSAESVLVNRNCNLPHPPGIADQDLDAQACLGEPSWARQRTEEARRHLESCCRSSNNPWLAGTRMRFGVRYYGELRGGIPHGQGRMCWPDGREFFGVFHHGERSSGTMCWKDGRMYAGQWEGGLPHGHGMCSLRSSGDSGQRGCNSSWRGEWARGTPLYTDRVHR